jgi:hypothetical protein
MDNLLPSGPTRKNHDANHGSLHDDDDAGVLDDPPTSFREDDHHGSTGNSRSSRKRARVDAGVDSRTNSDSVAASSSREELASSHDDDDTTVPTPVVVVQPREDDILLGRGRTCINYVGNQRFRDLVRSCKEEYATSSLSHGCDTNNKDDIVRDILQEIARRGGRFLQRVMESPPTPAAADAQEHGGATKPVDRAIAKSPTKKKKDDQTVLYQIVDLKGALTKIKQTLRDREYVRPADRGVGGGRQSQPPPPPLWPTASDHPPWLSFPVPIIAAAAQTMADRNAIHSTGPVLHRPVAAVPTAGLIGGTMMMLDRPQDDRRHGFQLLQMQLLLLHQQQQQRRDVEIVRAQQQQFQLLHDIVLRQLLLPHQQQSPSRRHSSPDYASWRRLASQHHHDDSFCWAPPPVPLPLGTLLTPPYHSTAASLLPNGPPHLLHEAARNIVLRLPAPATPPPTVLDHFGSPLLSGRPMPVPQPLMLAELSFFLQQQQLLSLHHHQHPIPIPPAAAAAVAGTTSTTAAAFWGNNNNSSFMRTTTTTTTTTNSPIIMGSDDHHHNCQDNAHHHDQHDDDDDDNDDTSFLFTRIRP